VVRSINPAATWKHLYFPVNEQLVRSTPAQAQRYDILFAGGLTKPKGFGDFLEILRLLVQEVPHARAGVVGHAETYPDAVPFLKTHNLTQNLIWLGRFPSQVDLFRTYRQTKVFLTPTYNDAFASTVRECMLLGTPVVSYKTGGIPYANRDGNENVVIVRQGDIMGMAQQVLDLLRNEKRREALAARAMRFAQNEFSLASNVGAIKNEYERLIGQVQEQ
jgi:D-inositol-3-phosphate glycosyltransferase